MNISIEQDGLTYHPQQQNFGMAVADPDIIRYLKGKYRGNKDRFMSRFFLPLRIKTGMHGMEQNFPTLDNFLLYWDMLEPFGYTEAFEIEDSEFRALVFSSIDIREMISKLGAKRIKVEGKELVNQVYNETLGLKEDVPYHVIYELWHVDGEKLGLEAGTEMPVIKAHCTTTDEEHWLWVGVEHLNGSPLAAIASLCVYYTKMKPYITGLIRQGDLFLFELSQEVTINEGDPTESMNVDDYFRLLKSQA